MTTKTIPVTYVYIGKNQEEMYSFEEPLAALFFLEALDLNSREIEVVVRHKTIVEGCETCLTEKGRYVPHDNCTCGKNKPHCTADGCY